MKRLDAEGRERLRKMIKSGALLLLIGSAYFMFVKLSGFGIPCVFHLVTGKYCPGCGITRMFMSLAEFDIESAVRNNLLVMLLLPAGIPFAVRRAAVYIKTGRAEPDRAEQIFWIAALVLTIVFCILRNTETFSFLAPI